MSLVTDIADALKDELNGAPGGTFSQNFTAKRKWLPRLELAKMGDTLYVTVVPTTDDRSSTSRGGPTARDFTVDVGVQKKLTAGINPDTEEANPEIDALALFVEEVADFLKAGKPLAGRTIVRTVVDPVCDFDRLAQSSVFSSTVTVLVKKP